MRIRTIVSDVGQHMWSVYLGI